MVFKNRIRYLRNKQHLTQSKIAEIIGVKRPSYAKYEVGENNPDFVTLIRLADFYNVSVDYLLGRTDVMNWQSSESSLKEIENIMEYISKQNIESVRFFNEQLWKDLTREDILDIEKHFEWIIQKNKMK